MKKAFGELSGGLIVIISVAILIAFFYLVVWPMIDNNFASQTRCEKAVCSHSADADGKVECRLPGREETFRCNFKG